jgi:cytidine deaminase
MAEFGADEMSVMLMDGQRNVTETTLGALLPRAFRMRKDK